MEQNQNNKKRNRGPKTNAFTRAVIQELTSDYYQSGLMSEDIAQLSPKDRLQMHVELMKFILPKPQSVDVTMKANIQAPGIEEMLRKLAEENE